MTIEFISTSIVNYEKPYSIWAAADIVFGNFFFLRPCFSYTFVTPFLPPLNPCLPSYPLPWSRRGGAGSCSLSASREAETSTLCCHGEPGPSAPIIQWEQRSWVLVQEVSNVTYFSGSPEKHFSWVTDLWPHRRTKEKKVWNWVDIVCLFILAFLFFKFLFNKNFFLCVAE